MPGNQSSSGAPEQRSKLGTFLKWVGAVTAVLSLAFAVRQAILLIGNAQEQKREIAELLKMGKDEQDAGDYESAWNSFEQAAKKAGEGGLFAKITGSLSEDQRKSREAQEDLAMRWVENVKVPEGKTFSWTVDKLIPVLTREAEGTDGVRKADLLAHLGWAYFLKARDHSMYLDEPVQTNIERHYKEALKIDPGNPYAHVYLGHLIIWERKNSGEAIKHFSAAVASGRALSYVRSVQLAALHNFEDTEMEFLKAVNDMVKHNEEVDEVTSRNVFSIYYFALSDKKFPQLISAVPADEQIKLIKKLFYYPDFDSSKISTREAALAEFQEAAGLRQEALKTWLSIRPSLTKNSIYITLADAAIKRLSK